MNDVIKVLKAARVQAERHDGWQRGDIFVTRKGRQIVGTLHELDRFRRTVSDFKDWRPEPVIDAKNLQMLGAKRGMPSKKNQIAVLVPKAAHLRKVNSAFDRRMAQSSGEPTSREVRKAFATALGKVGDYNGGGKGIIRKELAAIADAVMRQAHV
jgi:hypothetical protein